MEILLDTIDVKAIKELHEYGIIDGVTTNPSLMSHSKISFKDLIKEILSIVKKNVSVEVVSNDYTNMLKEAEAILNISDKFVIKAPITWDGIKLCNYLSKQDVKLNMTLCFSENQAIIAAKAGAYYVSPFIGRLNDIGQNGLLLLENIYSIYQNYDIKTKILAASVRSEDQLSAIADIGVDAVTLNHSLVKKAICHELTDIGLKKFNDDWSKMSNNDIFK